MNETLYGRDESVERIRRTVHERNANGAEYPSSTNNRGDAPSHRHNEDRLQHNSSGMHHMEHMGHKKKREHHARGEMVGGSSSAPGRGGSHMKPHFGKPEHGREDNHWRTNAIKQAHAENHRKGEMVGRDERRRHSAGDEVMMSQNPEQHRRGGQMKRHRREKECHAAGDQVGNPMYAGVHDDVMVNSNSRPPMMGNGQRPMRPMHPGMRSQGMRPQGMGQPQGQPQGNYRRGGRVHDRHYER